jgi:putative ABC transport system substrate-binding protein
MNRRKFIATLGGAIAAPLVQAQVPGPNRTLGMLLPDPAPSGGLIASNWPSSIALRKLGWYEGINLVVERRFAAGRVEMLPELAADLVRKQVDAIWTSGPECALAAARATKTVPIVFWGVLFPVEQGLVNSLPRPGRNVTGIAWATGAEVQLKPLQYLKEITPRAHRLSSIAAPVVHTVAGGEQAKMRAELDRETIALGFETRWHVVTRREDFDGIFAAILESRAQAVYVAAGPVTLRETPRIVEFMNANRLVSFSNVKEYAQAGGLFSYGTDLFGTLADSMRYVDKIFRGAKPADLPVELPSKYELAVNLKTAALLGLKIPGTVLVRAEHVIE